MAESRRYSRSQSANQRNWSVGLAKKSIVGVLLFVPVFCIPNYLSFSITTDISSPPEGTVYSVSNNICVIQAGRDGSIVVKIDTISFDISGFFKFCSIDTLHRLTQCRYQSGPSHCWPHRISTNSIELSICVRRSALVHAERLQSAPCWACSLQVNLFDGQRIYRREKIKVRCDEPSWTAPNKMGRILCGRHFGHI